MRSILALGFELFSRILATLMLYGVGDSVSTKYLTSIIHLTLNFLQVDQIISNVTPLTVWQFLSSERLRDIMLERFAFLTLYVFMAFPLLNVFEPIGTAILG